MKLIDCTDRSGTIEIWYTRLAEPHDSLWRPRRTHHDLQCVLFLTSQSKSIVKCLKDAYLSYNCTKLRSGYTNGLKMSKSTRNEYPYTICPSQRYVRGPIHVITIIITKLVNADNHKNNSSHHSKPLVQS